MSEILKKSMLEILTETVAFYSGNPMKLRSLSYTGCAYNGENDTHCAVGRCLLPKYQEQGNEMEGNNNSLLTLKERKNVKSHDELLQEEYRGHDFNFWVKLQDLHDNNKYWDNSGITTEGEIAINNIYELFKLNKNV